MGTIRRLSDGTDLPLIAECVLGRSTSATIRLEERFASKDHAKLTWTGSSWTLRDLGSSNGTFVDGARLEPGKPQPVREGNALGFGDPEAGWIFADDSPPGAVAFELASRKVRAGLGELLTLPSDEAPQISIYPASTGTGWVSEDSEGEVCPVEDQAIVRVDGEVWRLELPVISDATPMADVTMTLESCDFRFAVSSDEEKVELTIFLRGVPTRLEPREHGYLLLTLARARAQDAGLPVQDRGWRTLPELSRMLRLDANAINVAIHRARQQLASAGLEGAAGIVEVKRGRRRIGTDRFEITALETDD